MIAVEQCYYKDVKLPQRTFLGRKIRAGPTACLEIHIFWTRLKNVARLPDLKDASPLHS